jgi:hypothetical protein
MKAEQSINCYQFNLTIPVNGRVQTSVPLSRGIFFLKIRDTENVPTSIQAIWSADGNMTSQFMTCYEGLSVFNPETNFDMIRFVNTGLSDIVVTIEVSRGQILHQLESPLSVTVLEGGAFSPEPPFNVYPLVISGDADSATELQPNRVYTGQLAWSSTFSGNTFFARRVTNFCPIKRVVFSGQVLNSIAQLNIVNPVYAISPDPSDVTHYVRGLWDNLNHPIFYPTLPGGAMFVYVAAPLVTGDCAGDIFLQVYT